MRCFGDAAIACRRERCAHLMFSDYRRATEPSARGKERPLLGDFWNCKKEYDRTETQQR
jgi:hypothetical protein